MRTASAILAALTAVASVSVAAPRDPSPVFLRGYYTLDLYPVWQYSDASPWYVVKHAAWADQKLVDWGYVPVMHDGKRYYCLIDDSPPTGTSILQRTFMCGDPPTAEMLYRTNWRPVTFLYGAP